MSKKNYTQGVKDKSTLASWQLFYCCLFILKTIIIYSCLSANIDVCDYSSIAWWWLMKVHINTNIPFLLVLFIFLFLFSWFVWICFTILTLLLTMLPHRKHNNIGSTKLPGACTPSYFSVYYYKILNCPSHYYALLSGTLNYSILSNTVLYWTTLTYTTHNYTILN